MSSQWKRMTRMRSSRSRSRSKTPSNDPSHAAPTPASRRALLLRDMAVIAPPREPQEAVTVTPHNRKVKALRVTCTPGSSVNVVGSVDAQQTPGSHIRTHADESAPEPLSIELLERAEALGEDEEDLEDLVTNAPWHVKRWMAGMWSERQRSSSRSPPPTSASTSAVVVVPEVDVRPSTSGIATAVQPVPVGVRGDGSDLDSEYDDEFDVFPVPTTAVTGTQREIPDDEELEEPLLAVFNNIGRGMDDEADRLLGGSEAFDWVEGFESFRGVPEVFSGPTPGPIQDYDSAYDAFTAIWDEDIISRIVTETNRYADQTIDHLRSTGGLKPSSRLHGWVPTSANEILVLFGIFMLMAIDPRTTLHEYWASGLLGMPGFRRLMSFNRFILLSKFLHFVDNSTQRGETDSASVSSRRLFKLMPIIEHLGKKFDSLYNLERNISLDESLTLFKGRLSWVQTIKTKTARFGIKSYELCESRTGYMARFQIYTGKSDASLQDPAVSADLGGKTTKVVLELLQGLNRRGHCVTMDNFYNCPALARYLKRSGFDCLGTLRTNHRNVPTDISKLPKNVAKGTIIARQCGDVSIVSWKDFKWVSIISTYHDDGTYEGSRSGKRLVKPVCIRDYNKTMGGIDLKDQKLSMYLLERKRGIKWYIKMFKRLMNVSIHNAFVMYVSSLGRRNKSAKTHREFRYELAESLFQRHRPLKRVRNDEPIEEVTRLRRDIVHIPNYLKTNERQRCKICLRKKVEKKVHLLCKTCDVGLCFGPCWEEWHSTDQLITQERGRKWRRCE